MFLPADRISRMAAGTKNFDEKAALSKQKERGARISLSLLALTLHQIMILPV